MSAPVRLAALALALTAASPAFAEEPPITPYRPSVSSPAQLPATGQLEFEAGGLFAKTDEARRASVPVLFKLAFSEQWGLLVGGEAFVSSREGAQRARGVGDTNVVLKRAFVLDPATALGLEFGAKLPTAKDSIGSGHADYTVNGIVSRDFGSVHMDANLNLTSLGGVGAGEGRVQDGLSASFSTALGEQWGITGELSGTRRAGVASTAQALVALSYSPSKRLTIDVGLAHGLNAASTAWQLFSGLVLPIAKLW